MRKQTNDELGQLIGDLDSAISQAIENPMLFIGHPLLHALGSSCQSLMEIKEGAPDTGKASEIMKTDSEFKKRVDLLWQVRNRAGRLQMLMDSASRFYSSCFSPAEPEEMAYGVHGEWSVVANPSHLIVDC